MAAAVNKTVFLVQLLVLCVLVITATASQAQNNFKNILAAATVQLDAFGNNSIRVRIAPAGAAIVNPPYQGLLPQAPSGGGSLQVGETDATNGNLRIQVDPSTSYITATRISDGAVLLHQTGLQWGTAAPGSRNGSVSATIMFQGTTGERIYGLGEHRTGTVNQMPFFKRFEISQYYVDSRGADVMIPYYGSSKGYGFLWNIPSYGWVNITEEQISWHSNATQNIDFWITTTPANPQQNTSPYVSMLRQFTDAVGHAPPMPSYASGFWQCKNRYRNQTQLLTVAEGYKSRGLPISMIVIDYLHWNQFGDWSFNSACWPDPRSMVNQLQGMGIEVMVSYWPMLVPAGAHFQQFFSNGYLMKNLSTGEATPIESWAGKMYCYDATNPGAQAAYYQAYEQGYGVYGIKNLWNDAAEPERSGTYNFGQFKLSAGTDTEVGEAWVKQHFQGLASGMASNGIQPYDFILLGRSAWTGSWQHSAAMWSGDIDSTFDELALQIKVVQGVAISGQVLWASDTGGYANGNTSDPVFQDLIVRWFQFSAFCPIFRLHGLRAGGPPPDACGPTNGDNEVWNLAQDQAHYTALTDMLLMRENLRDYIAGINLLASLEGIPMVRPLIFEFPNDPMCATSSVEDTFMFGPDFLVAPVYQYLAQNRTVYLPVLPAGQTWTYVFQNTTLPGNQTVTLTTPIGEFPLFQRTPPSLAPSVDDLIQRNPSTLKLSA